MNDTRRMLSYFWSAFGAWAIGYILINYGEHKEILTLIIGIVGGTIISGIYGVYFGGEKGHDKPTTPGTTTADITATVTTTNEEPDESK